MVMNEYQLDVYLNDYKIVRRMMMMVLLNDDIYDDDDDVNN
jgi:hypothetical protein